MHKKVRPDKWPSEMPWRLVNPPPCHGRIGFKMWNSKGEVVPLWRGSPELDMSSPGLEQGNTSNVSMVNNSLLHHDLDMVVKEEREENMDTGAPASSMAPTPLGETPMQEGSEARDPGYWGLSLTSLFLGDIQMIPSPLSFPQGRMTCNHLRMKALAGQHRKMGRRNGVRFI